MSDDRTLAELRADFGRSPFLAMPIAGTIAWAVAGTCGGRYSPWTRRRSHSSAVRARSFPLGLLLARVTGEDLLGSKRPNELDGLFGLNILMANLVWGIAIPFWFIEPSSLPLSVGILAGLMWVPLSWMISHWVGLFHAISRTVLVVAAWFVFPAQRFVAIPMVVVAVYAISIHRAGDPSSAACPGGDSSGAGWGVTDRRWSAG